MANVIICDVVGCESVRILKKDTYGLDEGVPLGWALIQTVEEVTVNGDVGVHTGVVEVDGRAVKMSGVSAAPPMKQRTRRQYMICPRHRLPSWKTEADIVETVEKETESSDEAE